MKDTHLYKLAITSTWKGIKQALPKKIREMNAEDFILKCMNDIEFKKRYCLNVPHD